jgi:prepilin-type processing-associated H-X9-DG protein
MPPGPSQQRPRIALLLMMVTIAACGLLATLIVPRHAARNVQTQSGRPRCQSNLHQIGLAILLYQNDHAGVYPNTLDELLEEQISSAAFVCPDSNDTASGGATTQEVAADFHRAGHLSYIYIGKGLTDKTVTDDMVVIYEPLTNHSGAGMNILFGDGHAEFFNAAIGAQVITAANTGQHVRMKGGVVTAVQPATTSATN